jgi:hypothetical protein
MSFPSYSSRTEDVKEQRDVQTTVVGLFEWTGSFEQGQQVLAFLEQQAREVVALPFEIFFAFS